MSNPSSKRAIQNSTTLRFFLGLVFAAIIFVYSCASQPLTVVLAVYKLKWELSNIELAEKSDRELRIMVQKSFASSGFHIPMADIFVMTLDPSGDEEEISTRKLMQEVCGAARIYVWIPLQFELPFYGSGLVESCWGLAGANKNA